MWDFRFGVGAVVLGLIGTPSICFAQDPLIHHAFEESDGGWVSMSVPNGGSTAKVSLTRDTANVKAGKSSLQFDYSIKAGEMNVLALPTPVGSLAKAKSISFWIKSDRNAQIAIFLTEDGGGRYQSAFTTQKDKWQKVELAASDFVLAVGKDDPKDPDNKLDMDKVANITLTDFGQIMAGLGATNPDLATLLSLPSGSHSLFMDEFTVSDVPIANATAPTEGSLDEFNRPQISWIVVGDAKVNKAVAKPLDVPAFQVDFHEGPKSIVGLMKPLTSGKLTGKSMLSFVAASAKKTSVVVQFEENDGGKYKFSFDLPGNNEKKEINIRFSDFTAADDSMDSNNTFDLPLVNQIVFINISGLAGGPEQDNTIWIGGIKVVGK